MRNSFSKRNSSCSKFFLCLFSEIIKNNLEQIPEVSTWHYSFSVNLNSEERSKCFKTIKYCDPFKISNYFRSWLDCDNLRLRGGYGSDGHTLDFSPSRNKILATSLQWLLFFNPKLIYNEENQYSLNNIYYTTYTEETKH